MGPVVLLVSIALLHAPVAAQDPRRVTPGASTAEKPVYRELKAGEDRAEGLLQRVECPPGRPVTFVVKLQDRVAKYEAARLDAVEYIAYTPDFKGPMACGGRGRGDLVYLTWKKAGAASRAVAIEFLPRPAADK